MKKLSIWRVHVEDAVYVGERSSYLLNGKNAGEVEAKAIKRAKERDGDLSPGEAKHKPYVRSIELIGNLDDQDRTNG